MQRRKPGVRPRGSAEGFLMKSIAVLALIAVSLVASAQSAVPPAKPESPFLLRTSISGHVFQMKDSFTLEASLLNKSDDDVYLYTWDLCWNFAEHLRIQVLDAHGKLAQGPGLIDCIPPPPKPGDVYEFIALSPGNFYGISSQFKVSDLISKPGTYTLTVAFERSMTPNYVREYLPNDPIAKAPLWSRDEPVIEAPPIQLEIVP
jgi:hypothetical protein